MKFKAIMQTASQSVTRTAGRTKLQIQKHSPELLLCAGVIGFVGTVVLASKETLSADRIVQHHKQKMQDIQDAIAIAEAEPETYDYDLSLQRADKFKVTMQTAGSFVKLYAPAAAVGVLSLTCILVSNNILRKRYLGAVCAYNAVQGAFQEYRKRVIEEQGVLMDRHYRYGTEIGTVEITELDEHGKSKTHEETVENADPNLLSADDTSRYFDRSNANWDTSNEMALYFLRGQQNYMNDLLQSRGHVFLNEVYDCLGFERTSEGQVLGWVKGYGDDYIDFGLYGGSEQARRFVNGASDSILLEFNHDGVIWDRIA